MHEVVPGTVVRFHRGGHTTRTYWQLEARPHTDDLDTTITRIRELLEDIVERQLVADVKVGTLLSGGLDSSAITALAAKVFRDQGKQERIKAFSIDFKNNEENFRGNGIWMDPDTPYAVDVARRSGAEHVIVELENHHVLDEDVRMRVLRAQDLPISTGDMEHSLYHLCKALKEQVRSPCPARPRTNSSAATTGSSTRRPWRATPSPGTTPGAGSAAWTP